jgi:hypothetical protein
MRHSIHYTDCCILTSREYCFSRYLAREQTDHRKGMVKAGKENQWVTRGSIAANKNKSLKKAVYILIVD